MAKAHARHLAGGRAHIVANTEARPFTELVYRFEFPEAPGALHKFLESLQKLNRNWSISLFHYRNHGHDFGRVLVGLLVNLEEEKEDFQEFLNQLGYSNVDETNNSAFLQFLK
jgi:threonine dehydratase